MIEKLCGWLRHEHLILYGLFVQFVNLFIVIREYPEISLTNLHRYKMTQKSSDEKFSELQISSALDLLMC